jgi:hypothetical protein
LRFRCRCRRSTFGGGFWREISSSGGRDRQVIARTCVLSGPTQTCPKFGMGMRRAGCISPDASHRWSACICLSHPVGRVRMRSDVMRRPAGDALSISSSPVKTRTIKREFSLRIWVLWFQKSRRRSLSVKINRKKIFLKYSFFLLPTSSPLLPHCDCPAPFLCARACTRCRRPWPAPPTAPPRPWPKFRCPWP